MSELLAFYQKQVTADNPFAPWLAADQQLAIDKLMQLGFPARHQEEWKYTALDSFLKHRFSKSRGLPSSNLPLATLPLSNCLTISIVNGNILGCDEVMAKLPAGVVVLPLVQALRDHSDKVRAYLGKIQILEHGFHAMNSALMQQGVFIYIPSGIHVEPTLLIRHWQDVEEQAVYLRHLIVADSHSRMTIIEEYRGEEQKTYLTNVMTEVVAAEQADITHIKLQQESKCSYHIGHVSARQSRGSVVNSHLFSTGGQLVRSDLTLDLQEEGARCLLNGIYAPADGQHMDHHTLVKHQAPDCISEQDYKGLLSGHSRAVFNGQVFVAKNAQRTLAKQQNKNLLLSNHAEIDTKPQLEIFADDVSCAHGATVGQLDEDALFYLATRGIERQHATNFLVQAFAADNICAIANNELSVFLSNILTQQLS
ncbi:MAG: Fe-S cluster assembly protein SufD [Legionella sp.]